MTPRPAGFLVRLIAELIEFFLFGLILMVVLFYLAESPTLTELTTGFLTYLVVLALPLSIFGVLYRPLFTHYFGGNIGKLLTGLKVTNLQNNPLTIKQGLFRYTIGYMFSSVFFGLGYFSIIKDKEKLAFHDKTIGSKVVVSNNLWGLGVLVLVGLIIIHGFLLSQIATKLSSSPLGSEFGYLMINLDQQLNQMEEEDQESSPSALPEDEIFSDF